MEKIKINSFTDLIAWQEGHKLVLGVYTATNTFPKEEAYGLISQLRRCAVSVTSNIAEGFSRKNSKEKVQFYKISQGSLTELQNQILISRDVGYLTDSVFKSIWGQSIFVNKLIYGLVSKLNTLY